ncbi:WD40 repeat-like protein [Gymnopus androsaceus JB14]|uniref:WD40 repeat-like protein n=1 Tax=Gymnopus androsaceus JB14 TaxID=1447944 RepID=A0A6A4H4X5_9AGAR|nr:WD40 repeat-like protein [Gymnopus androsaceus JB14]
MKRTERSPSIVNTETAPKRHHGHDISDSLTPVPPQLNMFEGASHFQLHQPTFTNAGRDVINNYNNYPLQNQALQRLLIASTAAHTAYINESVVPRNTCTQGTRIEILEKIWNWLGTVDAAPVFWLTGGAGMGKTTIAMTICDWIEPIKGQKSNTHGEQWMHKLRGQPLVSFFCSRQLDSSHPAYLIPSICRRLADHSTSYARRLVEALEKDSTLAQANFHIQFENMLVKPWEDSKATPSNDLSLPIIIVDALDENSCGLEFLTKLLQAISNKKLVGLHFLVTSRTEPSIAELCHRSFKPDAVCHLQEVPKDKAEEDILRYLEDALPSLESPLLKAVAVCAGGLFIYAATVVKMVCPPGQKSSPRDQKRVLQKLLDAPLLLSDLYNTIVKDALCHNDEDIQHDRMQILHTIICAADTLYLNVVSQLSRTDEQDVSLVVDNLHAVMYIAPNGTIHVYHTSFADFILSPITSVLAGQFNATCDKDLVHGFLVQCCYDVMKERLHFNICALESSFVMDEDIPDLASRVDTNIDATLQYTILHWATHLVQARVNDNDKLCSIPQLFVSDILLFWLEAANLLKKRTNAVHALESSRNWIKEHAQSTLDVWDNAIRFCRSFTSGNAWRSTPHLYISTLSAWNPDSHISKYWKVRFPNIPEVTAIYSPANFMTIQHGSKVQCTAISPNGKQIVSGGKDGTVRVWEAISGEQTKELTGHQGGVWSVAFSPVGEQIVTGGNDGSVRVWNAASGEQVKELIGHQDRVQSVAFSPEGKQIVSGGDDGTVRLWDLASEVQVKWLTGHQGWVRSVAFSPEGKHIVSGGNDGTVQVWDAASGEQVKVLIGHQGRVQFAAFSPESKQIVSGGDDSTVHIWNLASGEQVRELTGHRGWVRSAAFSPEGEQIVSGGDDCTVRIWNARTGEQIKELTGHQARVQSVAFLPEGKQIVSGGDDSTLQIWDLASGEQIKELKGHQGWVRSVAFSPEGKQIISGGDDGSVWMWDVASGEQLKKCASHKRRVQSVVFSSDGKQIVSGGDDGTVQVCTVASGAEVKKFVNHQDWVLSVAFSPAGNQIVSGGGNGTVWGCDGTVRVWDIATGEQVEELTGHKGWVQSVAFSPDGKQIVSGGDDSIVRIWDVASKKQVKKLTGHQGYVLSVAFSPEGSQIVSGGDNGTVKIWNVANERQVKELMGHRGQVWSVAFLAEGKQIISGGGDGTVRVWNADSGEQVKKFTGHQDEVLTVASSPEGNQIISGGTDGTVRVWDAAITEQVKELFKASPQNVDHWYIDSSGWVMSEIKHSPLMWLSPNMRRAICTPGTKLIISRNHSTHLSFQQKYLGEAWATIYLK